MAKVKYRTKLSFCIFGMLAVLGMTYVAFFMAGAGEGWIAPLFVSIGLLPTIPILIWIRISRNDEISMFSWPIWVFLLVDAGLIADVIFYEHDQLFELFGFTFLPVLWIMMWISSHIVCVSNLDRLKCWLLDRAA